MAETKPSAKELKRQAMLASRLIIKTRPENSGLFICLTLDNSAHIRLRYPHFQQKVSSHN